MGPNLLMQFANHLLARDSGHALIGLPYYPQSRLDEQLSAPVPVPAEHVIDKRPAKSQQLWPPLALVGRRAGLVAHAAPPLTS